MTTTRSAPIKLKNRKPGRPRKTPASGEKARDIKQDILEATVTLIAQFGFDGFVLRDVADAVGVHTALVGYYFKTKQQLEKAALDQQLGRIEQILPYLKSASEMPPREAIRSIFTDLTRMMDLGEIGHRFNRWTLAKGGHYAEELHDRLCVPTMTMISGLFKKILPEISSAESEARALLLISLAESFANLKCEQLKYLRIESSHEEFVENFFRVIERQLLPEVCNLSAGFDEKFAASAATN